MLRHIDRRGFSLAAGAIAAFSITGRAIAQDVTLNAVYFRPARVSYAKRFLALIARINERGKGVIQIRPRGGPEIMPLGQFGEAQNSGLVDMINCPAGPYLNIVPEGEVFAATAKSPAQLRANGGFAPINEICAKKGSVAGFHIFTSDEPLCTLLLVGLIIVFPKIATLLPGLL